LDKTATTANRKVLDLRRFESRTNPHQHLNAAS
jgi:hypothetical protein